MVQIDIPVAFGIGCVFADAARRQLQTGLPEHYLRTVIKHNVFQTFFFSWIPVYFLINYFGWETTHMWWHADSVMAYPAFVSVFMLIFFTVANAGFWLGAQLVRRGHVRVARCVYLSILAGSAAWILAQPGSTFRVGSYAEWKAGTAPWAWEDGRFVAMFILVMVIWTAGLVGFCIHLHREGRRLGSASDASGA